MYVVRDIFKLRFGHFKEVKQLLVVAVARKLLPELGSARVLTDFTGHSYRLIMESSYQTLAEYEQSLNAELSRSEWPEWYQRFKTHVESSYREVLKQIM